MSIQTKLHVEEDVLTILYYRLSVTQNTDQTGHPSAKPVVHSIEFAYETIKNDPFFEKMVNGKMSDIMKFIISPVTMSSKSTTIELLDFYVLEQRENFDGINNRPMTTYVKISFASIIVNEQIMDVKYWKVNNPNEKTITPTIINEDEEPEFIEYYITDSEDNKIVDYNTGDKIMLYIETKNAVGDKISISINDKTHDFKHNGVILQNDTLKDYLINSNIEQVELEVIDQQD